MNAAVYFAQPLWFLAWIPLLLLLFVSRRKGLQWPPLFNPLRLRFPLLPGLPVHQRKTASAAPAALNRWLLALLGGLLITALAQPLKPGPAHAQTESPQAVDLIILANSSVSMALKDSQIDGHQVDRMTRQIDVLSSVIDGFQGARIALVVLGRPPAVWVPLTADKAFVKQALQRLQTTLGGRNSDISASLELVAERFLKDNTGSHEKIIILSSDAYQQLGAQPPVQAAKTLMQSSVTIITLAIGSSTFPEVLLGKAHLIYQPVDLALLQQLADVGHGQMIRASQNDAAQRLLSSIDRPDQRSAEQQPRPQLSLYQYPLLLAMVILLWQVLRISLRATTA